MRVACAQYAIRDGDPDANRERSVAAILDAARTGADLVVLPELANSGCDFRSRDHALALAEEVGEPDAKHRGPTVQAWRKAAEETGVFVVGGLLERGGGRALQYRRHRRARLLRALPQDAPLGQGEATLRAGQ